MEYIIENGTVFSSLRVKLDRGESFRAEAGAMISMTPNVELEAKSTGKGIFGSMKAAIGGEALFGSVFTCKDGNGEVVLAPTSLGQIMEINLKNDTIFCEGGAYLAGDVGLTISTVGSLRSVISGEGLFLQKLSGTGRVYISSFGAIIEKYVAPGETFVVDTGHLVAFESTVEYTIKKSSKSLIDSYLTAEGLVAEYYGPGKVWYQTRNLANLAILLNKFTSK